MSAVMLRLPRTLSVYTLLYFDRASLHSNVLFLTSANAQWAEGCVMTLMEGGQLIVSLLLISFEFRGKQLLDVIEAAAAKRGEHDGSDSTAFAKADITAAC